MLMIEAGTKKGDTRLGPLAVSSPWVASIIGRPPMPEPMFTPIRSAFSSVTVVGNANRLRGFKPKFSVR